jgi:excisionase family DNA binding protein
MEQEREARTVENHTLMTLQEVAEYLGVPESTIYAWRSKGIGPVGFRVGRHVRYRREAVDAWIEDQERAGTPRPAA